MQNLSVRLSYARVPGKVLAYLGPLLFSVAGAVADEAESNQPLLSPQSYAAWKAHILPTDAERAPLEVIPWRTTFADGLKDAATAGKPVLLWTMNGHPLGCT